MQELLTEIAGHAGVPPGVLGVLAGISLALIVGTLVRSARLVLRPVGPDEASKRIRSLGSWWALFGLITATVFLGKAAALAVFCGVSLLGLREFRVLARERIAPVRVWWRLVYLATAAHYLLIYLGWFGPFWTFIPVWVFVLLVVRLVAAGQTAGFLETAGITFLGLMLIVFLLSHAVLFFALPDDRAAAGEGVGLFLFLVLVTAVNDIAQALWGRWLGRRRITPVVSPNKTWEGLLLGTATTVAAGFALAGPLTPFMDRPPELGGARLDVPYLPVLVAGLVIAVGGFLGDVTMSAVKREVGVKDSGTLVPGQGGILDRIDSLTFTGPLFFYFTYALYLRGAVP